jgi:mono/diheme cytochrome c family protein
MRVSFTRVSLGLSCSLVALALAGAIAGCAHRAISSKPLASRHALAQGAEPAKPADVGKELFVARCGSCHDERGDKPLRVGLPLNQRKLSREVIASAVGGRVKDKSETEREAVVEYIAGLYVGEKQ